MGTSGVPIPTDDIIDAIKKNDGRVTRAAKHIGCTASAIWARAQQEEIIQKAIDDARKDYDTELIEESCDALLEMVKNREANAVFFSLKTKGRHLGFDQDQQVIQQIIPFDYKGQMDKAKKEKEKKVEDGNAEK